MRAVAGQVRDGRFREVETRFSPGSRAAVPGVVLETAWNAQLGEHGPVTALGEPVAEPAGPELTRVQVPVVCARGGFLVMLSVDSTGEPSRGFGSRPLWDGPNRPMRTNRRSLSRMSFFPRNPIRHRGR
ncbi:hypothetical protein [Amycolatopsis rubida]|uniref:Uncharacterized protein n=1 Tax=Amycolatopsis rubida TaxID=112413 RepID=A0A1I5UPB6_9PSEU|nr:hypothetical protein [Amycolatopsis rubida]SFP97038.1 hypothetical protein SAMN05421854_10834 [Amycolatopsis rubida]